VSKKGILSWILHLLERGVYWNRNGGKHSRSFYACHLQAKGNERSVCF
jgi:hypothetical protein